MSQQTINIGTKTNDNTGDTIRASMVKVNDNFSELYAGGGDSIEVIAGYSAAVNANFVTSNFSNGTPVASDFLFIDPNSQPTNQTPRQPVWASDNGSWRYRFQIASDPTFGSILHDSRELDGINFTLPNLLLAFDTTYYVRIMGNSLAIKSFSFPLTVRAAARGALTTVGSNPFGIAWSPTNDRLYCTNTTGNTVTAVRPDTGAVVATMATSLNPFSICYCPSNDRIYHTCNGAAVVRVITPSSNTVTGSIAVGTGPRGICYCPSNDRIYVANVTGSSVSVIDPSTDTVVATIAATSVFNDIIYCPTTDRIIYASSGSVLREINPATNTVVTTSGGLGQNPEGRMAYCPINNRIYIGGASGGTGLLVYNPVTHSLVTTITMGATGVYGVCYCPTTNRIYAAPLNGTQVQLVNPLTNTIITSVSGFSEPRACCYVPSTDNVWCSDNTGGTDTISPIS